MNQKIINMKFIATFLLLCFAIPASSFAEENYASAFERVVQKGVIRCAYFVWPPYLIKDINTGKMSGINYDFMEEIGKTLSLKIDWTEEVGPGNAVEGLETNRYDVVCSTLWEDAGRLKNSYLTQPTFYSAAYAVSRADDKRFDNAKYPINSEDVTLPVIDADYTYSVAVNNFPKAKLLSLPQGSDGSLLMTSVVTKKADVVFIDKGTMADFNKSNNNALRLVEGLPPLKIFGESLAVKSDEIRLGLLLDHAIRIIVDDGKADNIVKKYPDYNYFSPRKNYVEKSK